jgi:hypothetical protein
LEQPKIVPQAALSLDPDHGIYRDNFLRPASYINQTISLASYGGNWVTRSSGGAL